MSSLKDAHLQRSFDFVTKKPQLLYGTNCPAFLAVLITVITISNFGTLEITFVSCRFDKNPFQPPEEMLVKVEKRLGEFSERNIAFSEILNNLKGIEVWLHHSLAYFVLNFVLEASMSELTERETAVYMNILNKINCSLKVLFDIKLSIEYKHYKFSCLNLLTDLLHF